VSEGGVVTTPVGAAARSARPLRVLHVITRMIVGGAQENTMLSCALIDPDRFPSTLLTGAETGVEGELHTESRARGVRLIVEPSLVRRLSPWHDLIATFRLLRRGAYPFIESGHPRSCRRVARAGARDRAHVAWMGL